MKRIFTYIAMLALAVGCTDLYGPQEPSLTPDKSSVGSVEITLSEVTDNSFKVTVTPTGNVSYYSYLVDAATAAAELDAEKLYMVGYTSLAQGTVKYTTEAPSYSFTVSAKPNTTYQVYAVAASAMGFPGTVVSKSVTTTDTVAPAYVSVDSDENQVMFTFSENVTRNAEGGSIKATYYAYYSSAFKTQAAPAGEVTVPEEAIQVVDNKTLITVPGLPTGALWTIEIPEGAYVDAVGQPIPGYKSTFVMTEDGPAPKGFYGEVTYVELPMFGELELEYFSEWDSAFVIPLTNEYALANYSSKNFVKVTYSSSTDNSTSETVYTLTKGVDYQVTSLGFVVNLPEEPVIGADVTISIPTGCVYDVFGNDSEAWEHTMKYSFGYTLADVIGTYDMVQRSAIDGNYYPSTMVIEASDDAAKGNVMITTYEDEKCTTPIYATFDCDGGTLTIPAPQAYLDLGEGYEMVITSLVASGNQLGISKTPDPIVFYVNEPNVITGPNYYYGVIVYYEGSPIQFYDAYMATQATLAEPSEDEATPEAASSDGSANVACVAI